MYCPKRLRNCNCDGGKSNTVKTKEDLYNLDLNWNLLDYFISNRNDLLDYKIIHKKIHFIKIKKGLC